MSATLASLIFRSVDFRKERAWFLNVVKGYNQEAPEEVHLVSIGGGQLEGRSVGLYSMPAISDALLNMHRRGFAPLFVGDAPFDDGMTIRDVFALLNEHVHEHLPRPKPMQVTFNPGQMAPVW